MFLLISAVLGALFPYFSVRNFHASATVFFFFFFFLLFSGSVLSSRAALSSENACY